MKVILEDSNKLLTFKLTKEVMGNYWISNSERVNLVNVVAENGNWVVKSNTDVKIIKDINYKESELLTNVNQLDNITLKDFISFYIMEIISKKIYKVFIMPTYDYTMKQLVVDYSKLDNIVIGNNKNATINCSLNSFSKEQISIVYKDKVLSVVNNNTKLNMFVNNILETNKVLFNGDMVFIDGIMFSIVGNILIINNPNNVIFYDSMKLAKRLLPNNPDKDYSSEQETFVEVFNKNEYFQRPPRFKRSIEEKTFNIDEPSGGNNSSNEEMPFIYTMGPMMLMGVTSIVSGFSAVSNVISGKSTFSENATQIITSISMLVAMIVFPVLQRLYTTRNKNSRERKRRRKYKKYIEKKKEEILQEIEIERQILIENNLDLVNVANIILKHDRTLWDRKIEHPDFLNIRIGIGSVKPKININYPEEHFSMDEDSLKDVYEELFKTVKDIDNVPVTINLVEKNITGIVGKYNYVKKFLDGFMLNILAFHSYDMLKIVVISSNEKRSTWEKYRNIPHFWNNEKTVRYIGIDSDDISKVSNSLIQIYNERLNNINDDKDNNDKENDLYKKFKEYYLIISDEIDYIKNTSIFNELIKSKNNLGFSMVLVTERIDNLPNECSNFINIEENNSGIFENELISTNIRGFKTDIPNFNMNMCYLTLCNIPIDIDAGKFSLPKSYSFLEMYDVGNVNQLNIVNRWKNSNIIQSLSCPVGVNEQGELFKVDLHEKAHGPHGLVAGMTGSGKSEWIITYILSMAINYHPDEVQFVLIDYKGGGLAGTFLNKETGVKLPHLAGTITNLDISEINRSLASINSELKRRQSLFNQARDKLGESSVDIYKYQKWYRDKRIDTPISHLFIISDEFAELKSQQPEFMAELISTARIGRSLGVHLILATQKPSGVVDDQIWSNSKFRVCLKVQDKSDSNDMIRCPDAAFLKETGRFYFQVGYNEFFAKGQSAYAGAPYYESDKHKSVVDTDLVFVDNVGEIYKEVNSEKQIVSAVFKGEELPSIMKEIIEASNSVQTHVRQLWLDAIPDKIYIDELLKKYKYTKENFILNPVIGEYDAPELQKQDLLTLPISKGGNTIIYGMAGSGKENLLSTILYSLMISHYKEEVNVYVLDFGAEVLNSYRKSPIIGDIVTSNDTEKIKNYFKFIMKEFENRKRLFQDYNGDYLYYCSKSGSTMPNILTIINNFDNYRESVSDVYDETLSKVCREGEKYGIFFIITCNSTNSVSYRLSQNFKQKICLQLNDTYDYRSVFGNATRCVPANIKGRGLVEVGNVYEFQTAIPTKTDDLNEYINNVSSELLRKSNGRAKGIQTLPEIVNFEFIEPNINTLSDIPIGVYTESLEIVKYNFLTKNFNVVSSNIFDDVVPFMRSLIELISSKKETLKVIVFDGNSILSDLRSNVTYVKNNYLGALVSFEKFLNKVSEKTKQSLVIFTGLNKMISSDERFVQELRNVLGKIKSIDKINVLFIDSAKEISNYSNNDWFDVDKNNGIWISNGIDSQYLINVNKITRDMREEISNNFGYVINKGKVNKFKIIEFFKDE